MAKFEINKTFASTTFKKTVEAQQYAQEGEYFVFYANGGTRKVLTVEAKRVHTIDEVSDPK